MSTSKSIVISCAGTGSRLGLAQTKALIKIEGKTLIHWQLELLKNEKDIRIVVGFQASDVIEEVLKIRKDVIFVYNHNYFETKTGASLFLGGQHAYKYIFALDGDLLIHPKDLKTCLSFKNEFIGYSDKSSSNGAVYVSLNATQKVTGFSRTGGDFEWTGPALIEKQKLRYTSKNVFNIIEKYLPIKGIKVRAQDIDTYEDYLKAQQFIRSWKI